MPTASATTHSRSNGDFPVARRLAPNGRGCLARFCLCAGALEFSKAVPASLSPP